jgi:hypothetical protein
MSEAQLRPSDSNSTAKGRWKHRKLLDLILDSVHFNAHPSYFFIVYPGDSEPNTAAEVFQSQFKSRFPKRSYGAAV